MIQTVTEQIVDCQLKLPSAKVLIIKQDAFQRVGLCQILAEQESLTISDCPDAFKGLRLAKQDQPDVIILDLDILVASDFKLHEQLKAQSVNSKLIISSNKINRENILKVYSIAASYYYENGDISKLLLAITNTFEGSIYVDPETSHLLSNNLLLSHDSLNFNSLAPKELTALRELITGKDYEEIAASMAVSPHTVRNYIGKIVKKLGLKNRTQAVVAGVRGGLLAEL